MTVDSGTKRRLGLGLLSNLIAKSAGSIVQLIQVPLFLHYWSVPVYGEWMIITSIPAYLSFSNIGFGSVAGNEMTMSTGAGDQDKALRVFQSCWWLIVATCSAAGLLFAGALYLFPVAQQLKIHAIDPTDTKWILFYLGCSVLFSQLEQLLQSAYRCVGRYAYGQNLKSSMVIVAFAAMTIPVMLHFGPRVTALTFALANVAGTVALMLFVRKDIQWIEFGWRHASFAEIKRLATPAVSFLGFPIGNALNLQGSLLAVGYTLGPRDVVVFSTTRTVTRVALQIIQMVNLTFWPEISRAYGAEDEALVRTLHRRACQMALAISILIVAAMLTLGPWLLGHWTGGHVHPSRILLGILFAVVVGNALWATSSTLIVAINKHSKMAGVYMIATSLTILAVFLAAKPYGLYGVATSLLISELVMNMYVLPRALRLSRDTMPAFLASMLHYPNSLRPHELAKRLRRA